MMQSRHRNARPIPARRKQIALALGLALGLAATQGHADTALCTHGDPDATLIRHAAELGIEMPADADLLDLLEFYTSASEHSVTGTPPGDHLVTSCENSGPGSLREVVAAAQSGDIIDIDLTGQRCNIRLESLIVTSMDDLTLRNIGPETGSQKYAFSGGDNTRPITHNGAGTLRIDRMGIRDGKVVETDINTPARSGCVYSKGNVHLVHRASVMKYCAAEHTGNGNAEGGGMTLTGDGTSYIVSSTIHNNQVDGGGAGLVFGNPNFPNTPGVLHIFSRTIARNTSNNNFSGNGKYRGGALASCSGRACRPLPFSPHVTFRESAHEHRRCT